MPEPISEAEVRAALEAAAAEPQRSQPWQPWEVDVLRQFVGRVPARVLAEQLGRSPGSVNNKLDQMGLRRRRCATR